MKKAIIPDDQQDKAFLKIAQGAIVTAATLPSGLKVPDGDEGRWVVQEDRIVFVPNGDTTE
jgi:hypothetical protein